MEAKASEVCKKKYPFQRLVLSKEQVSYTHIVHTYIYRLAYWWSASVINLSILPGPYICYLTTSSQPIKVFNHNRTSTLSDLHLFKYTYIHTYIHTSKYILSSRDYFFTTIRIIHTHTYSTYKRIYSIDIYTYIYTYIHIHKLSIFNILPRL